MRAPMLERLRRKLQRRPQAAPADLLHAALDGLGEGAAVVDAGGRLVYVNEAARALFGEVFEPSPSRWSRIIGIYDASGAARLAPEDYPIIQALRGQPVDRDVLLRNSRFPDGLLISIRARPVFGADGELAGAVATFVDVTRTREQDRALRRLAGIVDSAVDAIYTRTADGTIIGWNAGAERLFGYKAAEVLGTNLQALVPPDRAEELDRFTAEVAAGRTVHLETERLHRSGRRVPVFLTAFAARDAQGEVIGVSMIAHDITQRRRADAELREQAALLDLAHDAICERSLDGRILYWNAGAERLYGWSRSEAVGRDARELLDTRAPRELGAILDTVLRTGEWQGELKQRHRQGAELVVDSRWALKREPDGRPSAILQIDRDVTADRARRRELGERDEELRRTVARQREAHAALESSELRFRTLADSAPVGLFLTDAAGRAVYMNGRGEELAGRRCKDWTHDAACVHPDDREAIERAWTEALRSGSPFSMEHRFVHPDGRVVWVLDQAAPQRGPDGRVVGWVGTLTDITPRMEAERKAERALVELARSNVELENFAAIASHDLQEPLRKITSFAELLRRRYHGQLGEDGDRFIGYVVDGASRMRSLIGELLTYSRLARDEFKIEPVDLERALDRAALELERRFHATRGELAREPLPKVSGDAKRLEQVLRRLLSNALKFRGEAPPRVSVRAERAEGAWRIVVEDNGIGVDRKYAQRIFSPFRRLHTREEFPGTGMGLAICRRIVERHGGEIWVEPADGGGSRFLFTIPDTMAGEEGDR